MILLVVEGARLDGLLVDHVDHLLCLLRDLVDDVSDPIEGELMHGVSGKVQMTRVELLV